MKRTVIIVAAIVAYVGCGYSFYHFGITPDYTQHVSLWLVFGPSLALLIAGFVFTVWACSDNIYNVKSGQVISHDFTPEHMVPAVYIPGTPGTGSSPGTPSVYVPAHWVDDDWAIQLRDDRGRTGWLHFSSDVFSHYPIGCIYAPPSS